MGSSSNEQTVGYKYYAGIHMVVCHGPVDNLLSIQAGEKTAWEGNITSNQTISISKPNLFGGERKEGGIDGKVDVLFGEIDQVQNTYLQSKIEDDVPAYTGVLSLVLKKMYLTAMTQYIKPWAFIVKRVASKNWQTSYADVRGGANPAHMIREVIIHKSWGMGLEEAKIDDASFSASAIQLYNEGFGLSMLLTGQTPCEDFIFNILKHISAVLYNDRITGQYKLKLIRDDYDLSTVPSFDESNILAFNSFERPQFAEMVNEIIVVYQPQGMGDKQSVSIQDLASITAQGGVISQTVNYIGIDHQDIAARVAQRDLRQYSTPLAQIRITVNRDGWKIEPGAVFKLSWEAHGLKDMACRATSINLGDYRGHQIIIDAVEDIFSLPTSSYLVDQTPQWVDPVSDPVPAPSQVIKELPYWNIHRQFNPAAISEVDDLSGYAQLLAENPPVPSPGYLLVSKASSVSTYTEQQESEYTPKAKLLAAINYTQGSISLKDVSGDLEDVVIGTYAYIEDEIVRIDSINLSTLVVTIGRGCLDTVPNPHPADSVIWFADELSGIDFTEYLQGDSVNVKALVRTGQGILPESSAPVSTLSIKARQNKPYPPGKLRINNLAYPSEISGALSITWAHRDRTLQLAKPIPSEEYGNIGPETGVTYSLKLYDEKNVLRVNQTGLTVTDYIWTTEETDSLLSGRLNEYVRLELWSVRAGIGSTQAHNFSIYRPQLPKIVISPVVSGTVEIGDTLTVSDGIWEFQPSTFTYQWTRNNQDISGATSNTYLITPDDDGKSLICIVTATNVVGSVTASSNLVFIGFGYEPWTPILTNPSAWYDASDSSTLVLSNTEVVSWTDKGNGNIAAIQNTPTYRPILTSGGLNGLNIIQFNGVNAFLQMEEGISITSDMMVAIVFSRDAAGIYSQPMGGSVANAPPYPFQWWSDNVIYSALGTTYSTHGSANTSTGYFIALVKRTAAEVVARLNGTQIGSSQVAQPIGSNLIQNIGRRIPQYHKGAIAEIVISFTDEERLEGYLAHKWGLQSNLPQNHPFKSNPPLTIDYWTPENILTELWLDASDPDTITLSGSNITDWVDKSGNNRNFTQATSTKQPTKIADATGAGLDGIRFDGIDDDLVSSVLMPIDEMTWIVFYKSNSLPATNKIQSLMVMRNSSINRTELALTNYSGYKKTQVINDLSGTMAGTGIDDTLTTSPRIFSWTYNNGAAGSPSSYSIRSDGSIKTPIAGGNIAITDAALSKIGGRIAQTGFNAPADIFEIIGIKGVASEDTLQKVEGYLAHKWKTSGILPDTHPYKTNPPTTELLDPYTVLLIHSNTFNGDVDFVDSSSKGHSITRTGTKITHSDTITPVFGSTVIQCAAPIGGLLNIEDSDDFSFDANFVIDFWVRGTAGTAGLANYSTVNKLHSLYLDTATSARVIANGANLITGIVLPSGVFAHYALIRSGTSLKAFVNGVQSGTTATLSGIIGASTKNYLYGTELATHSFQGYSDEVRISKGTDRGWFGGFTPPTNPYTK